MSKFILVSLLSFSFSSFANASTVFCSQEVLQKFFTFPLPLVITSEVFGPAQGEGNSEAEARVNLAKNLIYFKNQCAKDGGTSDIRVWCTEGSVECVGDVD